MSKNPIIVFEGIETSGKSTNLKKVIKYFKKNKIKYITFREPGGTKFSEILTEASDYFDAEIDHTAIYKFLKNRSDT